MAKVKIAGNMIVLTSSLAVEDIVSLAKHNPRALELQEEIDNENVLVFRVGTGASDSISNHGITFSSTSYDNAKKAVATLPLNRPDANAFLRQHSDSNIEDYVADRYGVVLARLKKLESQTEFALEETKDIIASVKTDISTVE